MATKTIDHMDFYVAIAPYKTDENGDQMFDSLRVSVGYRKGRGFYVCYHPGWGDERMWGCLFDFSNNPLTDGASIDVEPATKNSAKRIAEMTESLKMAKDVIAALFDDREWEKLKAVLHNVARLGYVEQYKEQAEKYLAERVSKRYEKAIKPTEPVVKQVDVMGLMGALQTKGKAKLSDFATPIESTNDKAAIKREESDACIDSTEREQAQTKFNENNNQNSTTMAQNLKAADLIGKTIVVGDNQATIVIKSVDGDKLSGEFSKDGKTTPMSFPISQLHGMTEKGLWKVMSDVGSMKSEEKPQPSAVSPQTSEVTTEADVQEVQDIVPVVTKKKSDVGSMIATPHSDQRSEKSEEKPQPSAISPQTSNQPAAKVEPIKAKSDGGSKIATPHSDQRSETADVPQTSDIKPQTSNKPKAKSVVGSTYRVELLPTKDGQKWPKLYGFKDESEAKKTADKMAKTVTYSWERDEQGEKRYYLKGGKKYCEVFQQLADALNIGEKAVIDKVCKASVAIFEGARAEGQKKSDCNATLRPKVREGRGKTEDVHQPSAVSPQTSNGYSKEDVAEMLRKVLAGGDVPEDIKKLLQAA